MLFLMPNHQRQSTEGILGRIPLSDPDQDSQWILVEIHLANRMTLVVSNVSRIHFGFKFIVNPDPDPIFEYALNLPEK